MKWNDMQIEVTDPSNSLGTISVTDGNTRSMQCRSRSWWVTWVMPR